MKRALAIGFSGVVLLAVLLAFARQGVARGVSASNEQPMQPLATLPVFRLGAPTVNPDSVMGLERSLPGLNSNFIMSDTNFAGSLDFTAVNTTTGASLQQFVATGGFFATNPRRAFSETEALLDYNPDFVCNLLQAKSLFPKDFTLPTVTDCAGNLPYKQTNLYLSIVTPTQYTAGINGPVVTQAVSEVIQIGVVYEVPLALNVGGEPSLPLGGPGGHLSVLLTGFGDNDSLDPQYPGFNAIASPMNGRFIQSKIGDYPVVPPQAALDKLRSLLPASAVITPGNPGLEYYVEHPGVTQTVMMPMWVFTDTQAVVDGQVVDLKGLALPGVQGFLPEVNIITPANNTVYFLGRPITVTALLSGTAGPFTYTLGVEGGSVLATGTAPSGTLQLPIASLPLPIVKGTGDNVVLRLSVLDGNGAVSADTVLVQAPLSVYLPVILRGGSSASRALARLPGLPATAYTMGVEWIQYYNGTNGDLPGVPPDANGFYNRLLSRGWTGRFNYGNNAAWEKDWRDCTLGGIDCTFGVDRAEFAYFTGHGSPARIYFGVSKDALSFFGGQARYQNVRWAAFSSCQTLRAGPYVGPGNPPLTHWFNAFQGAYMLLGFHSNMADIAFGGPLIDNMKLPLLFGVIPLASAQPSIREAWVQTAFQMNAGKPAYLYAVGNFDPANRKLPDPVFPFFYPDTTPLTGVYQYRWVWWD